MTFRILHRFRYRNVNQTWPKVGARERTSRAIGQIIQLSGARSTNQRNAQFPAAEGPEGLEILEYMRYLGALLLIVGLIGGAAWAAKRFGLAPKVTGGNGRIGVVAVQSLDTRRKLVLVRRDDREHLLVLGPTSETVIETGIDTGIQPLDSGGSFGQGREVRS